jgi:hypothetical protein
MNKVLSIALLLALFGGTALAQTQAAAGAVAPAPALAAGVQSQNIMDVKPDASADPGYAKQTNGEREKVQPGNNAPMWRQVGAGATEIMAVRVVRARFDGVHLRAQRRLAGGIAANLQWCWTAIIEVHSVARVAPCEVEVCIWIHAERCKCISIDARQQQQARARLKTVGAAIGCSDALTRQTPTRGRTRVLLKERDSHALPRQLGRRVQPADATADDDRPRRWRTNDYEGA